jgi:hypothetical protein
VLDRISLIGRQNDQKLKMIHFVLAGLLSTRQGSSVASLPGRDTPGRYPAEPAPVALPVGYGQAIVCRNCEAARSRPPRPPPIPDGGYGTLSPRRLISADRRIWMPTH